MRPIIRQKNIESYHEEFKSLVETNGITYQAEYYARLRSIDPGTFFTSGKLQEIMQICRDNEIDQVIISEPLSGKQERNISKALDALVFDRTQLILEIFEKNACTAAGKLQVRLAMLQHRKTRLVGYGIRLAQQAGHIGSRGPGETKKEQELRHIEQRIKKIQRELEKLERTRETQRKRRILSNLPQIALIGYTNAGKSTILNTLTHSEVLAQDKLFATLDTTTRELYIDGAKVALISDTVGFIQQLPHKLIEAFKSTLTELEHADLLLHVIDIADPSWRMHINVVHQILDELEIDKPLLYVFNKIDLVENPLLIKQFISPHQPHVMVAAQTKEGVEPLTTFLKQWLITEKTEKEAIEE